MSENIKCDICPRPAEVTVEDCHGQPHGACDGHREFLPGWIQDIRAESRSEDSAARWFEQAAHGDD